MDMIEKKTGKEASHFLSEVIAKKIREKPSSTIVFPTGRTMDSVYHDLVLLHKKEPIDCSKVRAFIVDEYIGLNKESEDSYRYYMNFHLFDRLNFEPNNIITPDVFSENLDDASLLYEKAIRDAGGIDLLLLGIGVNGHIGFNEPGSSIDSRTRVVALSHATRESNKTLFKDKSFMPNTAMTIGIGTILEARSIYLLATGLTKSEIILKLVNGDINSKLPATVLKSHKNFKLILDAEAARLL